MVYIEAIGSLIAGFWDCSFQPSTYFVTHERPHRTTAYRPGRKLNSWRSVSLPAFLEASAVFLHSFIYPPLKHGFHSHFPCFGSILFLPFFPPVLPLHYSFYSRTPTSKLREKIQLMKPGVWALHAPSNSQQNQNNSFQNGVFMSSQYTSLFSYFHGALTSLHREQMCFPFSCSIQICFLFYLSYSKDRDSLVLLGFKIT